MERCTVGSWMSGQGMASVKLVYRDKDRRFFHSGRKGLYSQEKQNNKMRG